MAEKNYFPPALAEGKFHCPHCGVFAKQFWAHIEARHIWGSSSIDGMSTFHDSFGKNWCVSKCDYCNNYVIWLDTVLIYPKKITVPLPNSDLNENIQADYMEAANIFNDSPRASAALLRLALQKLCIQLGEKGKNINEDIKNLVKKGLNKKIQQSLDILRITGNNAVHPGEINLQEDPKIVIKLFDLINFIAEKMISELNEIDNFYNEMPETAREAVEKRDSEQ